MLIIEIQIRTLVNIFKICHCLTLSILETSLANSEDPDEMQHNAAFHQGLHCLLRLKQSSETDIHHN